MQSEHNGHANEFKRNGFINIHFYFYFCKLLDKINNEAVSDEYIRNRKTPLKTVDSYRRINLLQKKL